MRDKPDDRFDRLHEGVPPWLLQPLVDWVKDAFISFPPMESEPQYDLDVMRNIEMAVRFDPPLNWRSAADAADGIAARFRENSPEAIDVLDYVLCRVHRPKFPQDLTWNGNVVRLKEILDKGGSVWDVTLGEENERRARPYQLTRRVAGPAYHAISEIGSLSDRAGQHLDEAWTQLLGTHPDPSAAYQAAVAAVEVAAKPAISPNHALATLGTMRGQLRSDVTNNPGLWRFELGGDPQVVVNMMSVLWENQLRHGNETEPISETQEQADAAVALALTLVRWFVTGVVRRV